MPNRKLQDKGPSCTRQRRVRVHRPLGYPGVIQHRCTCGHFNTWSEDKAFGWKCRRCGARWWFIQ